VAVLAVAGGLAAPATGSAAPVRIASGELDALVVHENIAYAVVEQDRQVRPLALVRTSGRSAGRATRFGDRGAEFADLAVGDEGVVVSWGRAASGGELWFAGPVADLERFDYFGQGTGPGRLALDGRRRLLAGPDQAGDAVLVGVEGGAPPVRLRLTANGPHERHYPQDIAMLGGTPLVLDQGQRRSRSALYVHGARAPRRPVVSVRGVQGLPGTIAVTGSTIRVAFMRGGSAYLASAAADPDARWRVRRLGGPGGGEGAPAVTPAGQVLYAQGGFGGQDVYLHAGSRARRLTATAQREDDVALAAGGARLFGGWTRIDRRTRRTDALVQRLR
jgi:hypothetical protein